ncbi:hypothetical protein GCM10009126_15280 [Rhodanobacter caeni]|uniref:Transposase n=1 Tax=Rhodanobacter caeni TaxID=657654 RepID=A0ABP3E3G8_9GAMM
MQASITEPTERHASISQAVEKRGSIALLIARIYAFRSCQCPKGAIFCPADTRFSWCLRSATAPTTLRCHQASQAAGGKRPGYPIAHRGKADHRQLAQPADGLDPAKALFDPFAQSPPCARQPGQQSTLIPRGNLGSQYVSIRYSERLAEASIESSVGSKGDSCDNAISETINGLCKPELVRHRAP